MSGEKCAWMALRLMLIGSVLAFSAPVSGQTCTASANANAGDDVTVLAILHTVDPNENGEGEPLSVTISNGGGTFSFPDYETTHSFNFQAAATAPVTVVGTNVGFDGDESCEVSVAVNAHHRFTQAQKNVLIGITGGFGIASGSAWVIAEVCAAGGPIPAAVCSLPAGVVAASSALIGAGAGFLLLIDPIDMNFMVIPIPQPATFPSVTAGGGLTQADADALNALLSNEAAMIGLLRAATTAANRASGAQSVGDTFWEQKQVDAINGFMLQLGALLTKEANIRGALVALLASENFPTVTITPQQVLNFEAGLAFQGWSQNALGYLHQLGADDAFIEYARPLIFTQDINVVSGRFPLSLANPTLISLLRQGGRDLTPFVGVPQNANCHGVSVSALAAQFGGISKAAQALGFGSVQNLQSAIREFCGN
jgi:hypothetical protein